MKSARTARVFQSARRLAVLASTATLLAVLSGPVFAEPNFAPVKYLTAVDSTQITDLPAYASISCVVATCVATGPNYDSGGNSFGTPAVMTSTSGTWSAPMAVTLPSGHVHQTADGFGTSDGLPAVSCWQVGYCAAVGDYGVTKDLGDGSGPQVVPAPMAAIESAGSWSAAVPISMPNLPGTIGVMSSVSCVASGDCTAIGSYESFDYVNNKLISSVMITTESAGVWTTAVDAPTIAGSPTAYYPLSISCTDATNCSFVVIVDFHTTFHSFVVRENAGTWGSAQSLTGPATKTFSSRSISCATADGCVIVGVDLGSSAGSPFGAIPVPAYMIEHAGVWGPVGQLPQPRLSPPSDGGVLNSVACPSATVCVAVGDARVAPLSVTAVPMAVTLTNGRWSSEALYAGPVFAGATRSVLSALSSVSCPSISDCHAVGFGQSDDLTVSGSDYAFSTAINPTLTPASPASPFGLRATLTRGAAVVTWNAPFSDGGSPIVAFTMTTTSPGLAKRTCVSTSLNCRLVGLVKGHRYTISVQARNLVGFSKPSAPLVVIAR